MTWTVGDLAERLRSLADQVAAFPAEDKAPRPLVEPLGTIEGWAQKHEKPELHARSCVDRIEAQAKSNEETYSDMFRRRGDYAKKNDDRDIGEILGESPLSVTRKRDDMVEVQESWGGPSDGYEVTFGQYGAVESVRYYFRDWFDGAWLDIDEDDYPYTWKYAEHWAQAADDFMEVEA